MDKTIAGLLGAVGVLVVAAPGQAAPVAPPTETVLQAQSYAELLRPVPNALATLRAMDEAAPEGSVELAQLGPVVRELVQGRDHHHHHHHRYYRRRYHHHHHHHHHHGSPFR